MKKVVTIFCLILSISLFSSDIYEDDKHFDRVAALMLKMNAAENPDFFKRVMHKRLQGVALGESQEMVSIAQFIRGELSPYDQDRFCLSLNEAMSEPPDTPKQKEHIEYVMTLLNTMLNTKKSLLPYRHALDAALKAKHKTMNYQASQELNEKIEPIKQELIQDYFNTVNQGLKKAQDILKDHDEGLFFKLMCGTYFFGCGQVKD